MIFIKNEYAFEVIKLINEAKTNIDIMLYQWNYYSYLTDSPIQKLNLAIRSALSRGVPTRILLHAGSPSDHLQKINARTAGIFQSCGAQIKYYFRGGVLHAKCVIIDKRLAIIGSHNYSQRSMKSNIEISVLVDNGNDIRRLNDYFNILWEQS